MTRKILITAMLALCLFLTSCYPELSVQQYDKLKEDLVAMDEQRAALEQELAQVNAELAQADAELENIKTKNTDVRKYIDFLVKLISTQNSESLLEGEFDNIALFRAKTQLLELSKNLENQDINYFVSLIDLDNSVGTLGAYYKAIEESIKSIKQKLEIKTGN